MATKNWIGVASAVKQITRVGIGTACADTVFALRVNNKYVTNSGGATASATASALAIAWNAATSPYFTGITAKVKAADKCYINLCADTAGIPFSVTASAQGGTGIFCAAQSTIKACQSKHHYDVAQNWDTNSVPTTGDTVVIADNNVSILYGLDQHSVAITELNVRKTYTGWIGLHHQEFGTSLDDSTTSTAEAEYREKYLRVKATRINIGEHFGPGSPTGSERVNIHTACAATTITVFDTSTSADETGLTALRLKADDDGTRLFVRKAPGGVAVAGLVPGENSVLCSIDISDAGTESRVLVGDNVALRKFTQTGGTNTLQMSGALTNCKVTGGVLRTEGVFQIATTSAIAGTLYLNHTHATCACMCAINLFGATIDTTESAERRTFTRIYFDSGNVIADWNVLSATTLTMADKKITVSVS